MKPKKIVSRKILYRTPRLRFCEDVVFWPDGRQMSYAYIKKSASSIIIPFDGARVYLRREYRHPIRRTLWGFPQGAGKRGETPLTTAKREFLEETGLHARQWKRLGVFFPVAGFVSLPMHVFLAKEISGHARRGRAEDGQWFSLKELSRMIARGRLLEGNSLAAFALWRPRTH